MTSKMTPSHSTETQQPIQQMPSIGTHRCSLPMKIFADKNEHNKIFSFLIKFKKMLINFFVDPIRALVVDAKLD